jgi:hypothetical protein
LSLFLLSMHCHSFFGLPLSSLTWCLLSFVLETLLRPWGPGCAHERWVVSQSQSSRPTGGTTAPSPNGEGVGVFIGGEMWLAEHQGGRRTSLLHLPLTHRESPQGSTYSHFPSPVPGPSRPSAHLCGVAEIHCRAWGMEQWCCMVQHI